MQDELPTLAETTSQTLTPNDIRLLRGAEQVCAEWDGLAPHGPRDWAATRRLLARGIFVSAGWGECQTCPVSHDARIYQLTDLGREVLEVLKSQGRLGLETEGGVGKRSRGEDPKRATNDRSLPGDDRPSAEPRRSDGSPQ